MCNIMTDILGLENKILSSVNSSISIRSGFIVDKAVYIGENNNYWT